MILTNVLPIAYLLVRPPISDQSKVITETKRISRSSRLGFGRVAYTPNPYKIRGVFKKRPNFLNSAPTSIESALRLLTAPSVRFWKQIAICPVSLWELVVELHPLNWTRAQAVRRISEKKSQWKSLKNNVCVRNFAANLVKFYRHFNCLTKHTGRTIWAERSPLGGLSFLKMAECRSVKIPGLDDLPHQQKTTMSREFVLWFVEIVV